MSVVNVSKTSAFSKGDVVMIIPVTQKGQIDTPDVKPMPAVVYSTHDEQFGSGDITSYSLIGESESGPFLIKWIKERMLFIDPAPKIDGEKLINEYEESIKG